MTVVVIMGVFLTLISRTGTENQTKTEGLLVAQLLAKSTGVLDKIPEDIESMIGDQMLAQAHLASHLVALAESPKVEATQIIDHFRSIIKNSLLSEVIITDQDGLAYIQTNSLSKRFKFEKKSKTNPSSSEFYPIIKGKIKSYIQKSFVRDDEKLFKYVAVAGIDKPRIVQVGYDLSFLTSIKQRIGFQRLVDSLLNTGEVHAIWILNKNLITMAYGANKKVEKIDSTPSEIELDHLEKVISEGKVSSFFSDNLLKVMAPIYGKNNEVVGATLVQLPTDSLRMTLGKQLKTSVLVALLALILGGGFTYVIASSLSKPVTQITRSAGMLEKGEFDPDSLETFYDREDELGKLARVFQTMGIQIMNREEKLDTLVRVRTKALESKTNDLQNTLVQLQNTQSQLVAKEKMASLGQLTAGIAHELKNPLNFVINFSESTVELIQEFVDSLDKENAVLSDYLKGIIVDVKENAGRIHEHGKNAEIIINTMIQHSHPDGGKPEAININEFLKKSYNMWNNHRLNKGQSIDIIFESHLDESIADIELISQEMNRVISYILDNAYYALNEKKSSDPNFNPTISIATKDLGNMIECHIRDNGTGIPEDIKDKIFNPFFTTKPTRKGSTGMGLSLSYDIIVQKHAGQITVESIAGEYTDMIIRLPKGAAKS